MFRVSWSDVRQVLALALGGAVLTGGFAIGDLYVKTKLNLPKFTQNTKAIQNNVFLCRALGQIEERAPSGHVLRILFLRVVFQIDEIAFLYQTFQKDRQDLTQPIDRIKLRDDMLRLQTLLICNTIPEFKQGMYAKLGAQEVIDLEDLLRQCEEQVQQYVQNLWNLTDDIELKP